MRARAFFVCCLFSWSALAAEPAKLIPRAAPEPAVLEPSAEPAPKNDGITTKWWFWTVVGVVAAGAFAGAAIAVAKPQPRGTTLSDGDFRQ